MRPSVSVLSVDEAVAQAAAGAVVLDARGHRQRGLRFIRGASRFAWSQTCTGAVRSGRLGPAELLAERFGAAGVSWDDPVLVVGAGSAGWGEGARVAWTLDWLGHPAVSWCPLSGSWPRWPSLSAGGTRAPWPGSVRAGLRPHAGWSHEASWTVLDVRQADEFAGACRYGEARGGHVPGACHLPLTELWSLAGVHGGIQARLASAGIGAEDDLVTICTGGVRSAAAAVLLAASGHQGAIRHDEGGMWAWSADATRPMAVGHAQGS